MWTSSDRIPIENHKQFLNMASDRKWVIVRIDGKIAAISTDYKALADVAARLAKESRPEHMNVVAETVSFDSVWELRCKARWEDFILFGTEFQKKVWRTLYDLTHPDEGSDCKTVHGDGQGSAKPRLLSYSDFAELCENRAGVRAVAHAVGLNPLAVVIPCHLVVPKESIDRIREIRKKAEDTIFKGDDLCLDKVLRDPATDFGEYSLGRRLKRELILKELL